MFSCVMLVVLSHMKCHGLNQAHFWMVFAWWFSVNPWLSLTRLLGCEQPHVVSELHLGQSGTCGVRFPFKGVYTYIYIYNIIYYNIYVLKYNRVYILSLQKTHGSLKNGLTMIKLGLLETVFIYKHIHGRPFFDEMMRPSIADLGSRTWMRAS